MSKKVNELKALQLEILIYVKNKCQENNLRIFLVGGTLLGSIRHNGFIPWDDDIDIAAARDEYEKLIILINEDNSKYKAITAFNNKSYYYPFCKIVNTNTRLVENGLPLIDGLGINIDLFPYDGLPQKFLHRFFYFSKIQLNLKLINLFVSKRKKKNMFKKLFDNLLHIFFDRNKYKSRLLYVDSQSKKMPVLNSKYIACLVGAYGQKEIFEYDDFFPLTNTLFEGLMFSSPKKHDKYLRALYGDFMKLPKEQERNTNHSFSWEIIK